MLFGKPEESGGLPPYLELLLLELSEMLLPYLPCTLHEALFNPCRMTEDGTLGQPRARQIILNRYMPGEGISPHVDLVNRFDDGIIGVSLGSGCVMDFEQTNPGSENKHHALYLPPGGILILTGEARYEWTHGIARRTEDRIYSHVQRQGEVLKRGLRLSITFRWLLPGAHIVGVEG